MKNNYKIGIGIGIALVAYIGLMVVPTLVLETAQKDKILLASAVVLLLALGGMILSIKTPPSLKILKLIGKKAQAKIESLENTGISKDGMEYGFTITVTVFPNDAESFTATIHSLENPDLIPSAGTMVNVLYDPKHKDNILIED